MRQSVAPNRVSQIPHPSSTALARLLEKKKEFYAVSALEKASALYLERIEGLKEDCDIMANAGEGWFAFENGSFSVEFSPVHGQVLAQWPKMFQILSQFCKSGLYTDERLR